MDLIEMKCTPGENERKSSMCCEVEGPRYPYGLRLELDEESIQKLGLTELPEIDSFMVVMAKAKVVNVSKNESEGGKVYRHLCLQVTALKVKEGEPEKEKVPLETKMYGKT